MTPLLRVGVPPAGRRRRPRTRRPCGSAGSRRHRRRRSSPAAAVGPGQHLLGAPPVLLERFALPGEHRHTLRVVRGAVRPDRRPPRRRGPGWRRCCSDPSARRRRARRASRSGRRSASSCAASRRPSRPPAAGRGRTRAAPPSDRASHARPAGSRGGRIGQRQVGHLEGKGLSGHSRSCVSSSVRPPSRAARRYDSAGPDCTLGQLFLTITCKICLCGSPKQPESSA